MKLVINDRFLLPGVTPKCAVFSELGNTVFTEHIVRRVSLRILGAEDELTSERVFGQLHTVVSPFPHYMLDFLLPKLVVGQNQLLLYLDNVLVDSVSVTVIGVEDEAKLRSRMMKEQFLRSEITQDENVISGVLFGSWHSLNQYLGRATPQVLFVPRIETSFKRKHLWPPIAALKWSLFHIDRVLYDTVFYGGLVKMSAGEDRYAIFCDYEVSGVRDSSNELFESWLKPVLDSMNSDNLFTKIEWMPEHRRSQLRFRMASISANSGNAFAERAESA